MIRICHEDNLMVYDAIQAGHIDATDSSFSNLIDSIVLTIKCHGILSPLSGFEKKT